MAKSNVADDEYISKINTYIFLRRWKKLTKKFKNERKEEKLLVALNKRITTVDENQRKIVRNPIHEACLRGISEPCLRAMLNLCPESAKFTDDEGSTPLHYTVHYDDYNNHDYEKKDVGKLKLLTEKYPESMSTRDRYGYTPLLHAVEHDIGIHIDKLAVLLSTEHGVKALKIPWKLQERNSRRKRGDFLMSSLTHHEVSRVSLLTPLYLMWDIAQNVVSSQRFFVRSRAHERQERRERKKTGKRLKKAQLMLEVAYLNKPIDIDFFDNTRTLGKWKLTKTWSLNGRKKLPTKSSPQSQSTSRLGSSPNNIKRKGHLKIPNSWDGHLGLGLVKVEQNENKFRVLHAVLTLYEYLPHAAYEFAMAHYKHEVHEAEEETGNYPLHLACSLYSEKREIILEEMLSFTKEQNTASICNHKKQLPLHIALMSTDPWSYESINKLMNANAWACQEEDKSSGLYPFQLAAVNDSEISVIYTLLREFPTMNMI